MSSYFKCVLTVFLCISAPGAYSQAPSPLSQLPPATAPPDSGVTLKVEVRAVLVPVVVRDAQGHAVGGLTAKDFTVYDQGKRRQIAGFNLEHGAPQAQRAPTPALESSPQSSAAVPSPAAPTRYVIFLFDDRHLGPGELLNIRQAGARMLDEPLPEGDRAIVLSFLGVNSGIAHDHTVLQSAVMKLKASNANRPVNGQCPDIDYFTADQILNKHSRSDWDIAYEKAANCLHQSSVAGQAAGSQGGEDFVSQAVRTAAQQALEIGDQDVRETLSFLRDVVHSMQKLPGQRTLILISPGFFSGTDLDLAMQSQILDIAASNDVTISALSAPGLVNGFVGASQSTSGSVYGNITGQPIGSRLESLRASEDIMATLADGTGGTFFHNGNDLAGGLKALEAGPEYRYVLEVSLQDVKANGAYHALKVEVNRKDVKVQARQGYFAPRPHDGRK